MESIDYGPLFALCPNCARIDGPEQVGDPLLAGLTPLGVVLPNHAGADPQDIGAILFGAATGQDLGGQRVRNQCACAPSTPARLNTARNVRATTLTSARSDMLPFQRNHRF